MKACPHCNEPMASVATHCPNCHLDFKGKVGNVRDVHDEPLGFKRDQDVLMVILMTLGLGVTVAIFWFVR